MSNEQKLPLAQTLVKAIRTQIGDALERQGQMLPCSVADVVSSGIVIVNFEINSAYTLPQVKVPVYGFEYIRYPIRKGDKGFVVAADASLAQLAGLGAGVANLTPPGNLSALVFLPFGSTAWSATPDPDAVVLYGPNGVQLRDTGNASNITLTPRGIVITTSTVTVNANVVINGAVMASGEVTGNGITLSGHVHGGVVPGGSDTSGPIG